MIGTLRRNPMGPVLCTLIGLATLVAIAVFRVPLAWVVIGFGVVAWSVARWCIARKAGAA